jgi:hypothetical protein
MDVTRRREAAHLARQVRARPGLDEAVPLLVEREQLFVLNALDDAEHAPGHVVVGRRHLAGLPDEGDDREAPVGGSLWST